MTSQIDSVARDILNHYRCELGAYQINKMDDPLLCALKKECALTDNEIESIQNCSTSCGSMCALLDYVESRVTREMFLFFVECVGSVMKMPDLQQNMLNAVEKGCE